MVSEGKNKKKILEQVREVMRLKHYSIHTERSYCDWIKRFVLFHKMRSRDELFGGPERKIEDFLSSLAIDGQVAPSTQNQAMNALVFLYKKVLKIKLDETIDAIRALPKKNIPVVLTMEETAAVITRLTGHPKLII